MQVSEAVVSRRSVRAFLPRDVAVDQLKNILERAARAPSGGNLQPWKVYVLTGPSLKGLVDKMSKAVVDPPAGEGSEYNIYPPEIKPEYAARRRKIGYDLYEVLGIAREDRAARAAQMLKNFEFFGAPVGLFFTLDRQMDRGQWADLGMYIQNLMLLAREQGLDTCAQEAWANYPKTVGEYLELPEHEILFCGMALGYADVEHPSAKLQSEREEIESFVKFL